MDKEEKIYSIKTKPSFMHLLLFVLLPLLFIGGIIYRIFNDGIDLAFIQFLGVYFSALTVYTFVFYRRISIYSNDKVRVDYLVRKPKEFLNIIDVRIKNPWDRYGLYCVFIVYFENGKRLKFNSRFHSPEDSITRFFYKFYKNRISKK